MKKIIFLLIAYIFSVPSHAQKYPPGPTDLKAAYCVALLKKTVTVFEPLRFDRNLSPELKLYNEERLSRAENNLQRLRGYLIPRIDFFEAEGLLSATSQFDADDRQVSTCMNKCSGSLEGITICQVTCAEKLGTVVRHKTCDDLSWLPY